MSPLAMVGVSHRDTPLQLLELVAYRADEIGPSLRSLASLEGLNGVAILSTCNRTEVYAEFSSQQGPQHLAAFLAADRGVPLSELAAVLSIRTGSEAVARHLFRVAAGLDSIALGEDEIQGQVREAHALALETGVCGEELDGLFRSAVSVGRRVRRETPLSLSRRSLARSALDLVTGAGGLGGRTVLVVGAGKVASAVVGRLREEGARLLVCSRTEDRARRLASAGDEVLPLAQLHLGLIAADLLVCCTAAPHLVVDASQVRAAMEHRGGRSLMVVDLSLPRNVDEAIRAIPGVGLIDLQDLGRAGIQDAPLLLEAARRGEAMVEEETERFVRCQASRRVDGLITALRGMTEELCRAELERSLRGRELVDRETALQALRGALNKLLHGPTMAAKEAAAVEDERRLSDLRCMFGLDGSNARVKAFDKSPLGDRRPLVRARAGEEWIVGISQTTCAFYPVFRAGGSRRDLDPDAAQEVENLFKEWSDRVSVRGVYSTIGFRPDADLMLWLFGPSPDVLQDLLVAFRRTAAGRSLELTSSLLGIVRPAEFAPDHIPAFVKGEAPRKYLCVYPFVRTEEWYLKGAFIEIRPLTWCLFEADGQLLGLGSPPCGGDEWPD